MKTAVYLLCGLIGGGAGALLMHALRDDAPARVVREAPPVVRDDALRADVAELRREVARLRERASRDDAMEPGRERPGAPTGGAAAPGDGPEAPASSPDVAAVVARLRGKRMTNDESNRLFGWLTMNKTKIRETIAAIEAQIEADPNNADLHVALATAWVAELTNNTMQGPQQGLVWTKARAAYDKAIELEPNHWQARFGKAFGTSMAPEFLGRRPKAIEQFEELRKIQESQAPEPHHAQVYFRLGTLYKDAGNPAKAREVWEQGLRLFPDNEQLKGTLEVSTKK